MTVSTLWALSNISLQDKCKLVSVFAPFQYIFWNVDKLDNVVLNSSWINVLVIIIWFISLFNQIANTLQIWQMSTERLASTEQLFVNPMYNAALIDQSLVFNRRWYKLDLISGLFALNVCWKIEMIFLFCRRRRRRTKQTKGTKGISRANGKFLETRYQQQCGFGRSKWCTTKCITN